MFQTQVTDMEGRPDGTLNDLCNKPVPGEGCMIQSIVEFFQNNMTLLKVLFPSFPTLSHFSRSLK